MAEFGHTGIVSQGICIDNWGAGPFFITADGKTFRFGDSDRFGPYICDKHGNPVERGTYPKEKSPFWRAHFLWVKQGRKLEDDGRTCIWREPKPTLIRVMPNRKIIIIEHGDEHGKMIDVETGEEYFM